METSPTTRAPTAARRGRGKPRHAIDGWSYGQLIVDKDVPVHGAIEPCQQMVKTLKEKPSIPTAN